MERLFYTTEETAEILGVSRATVYRLLKTGQLVGVKVGRSRRITGQALERFARDLEKQAREAFVMGL